MPTLTIDGAAVTVPDGATILDAARALGITIPTLCHDEQLHPYGSCFLCVVAVEGTGRLLPSCATPAADGMVVTTDSDEIAATRKTCLELILSNHYADCVGPCQHECPAGVDAQGYIALVAEGKYREAVALVKERNPLPSICGRVCTRNCEVACRRNMIEGAGAIDDIKRFAADHDMTSETPFRPEAAAPTGKRVAVVGSGPAGLSAAYYLARDGQAVTVLEAMDSPGGLLRYGIPDYRLPKDILDREIAGITDLGVEIRTGVALGRDTTLEALRGEYDAVVLGIGLGISQTRPMKFRAPGEDVEGVVPAIDYLKLQASGQEPPRGENVVVVGGGNAAIDAARTAVRLAAASVTILYRRSREEMPAAEREIHDAEEEGVKLEFLAAPKEIEAEDGRAARIVCQRMELDEPDDSGRRRPVPIEGSEFTMPADLVIAAIGQSPEIACLAEKDPRGDAPDPRGHDPIPSSELGSCPQTDPAAPQSGTGGGPAGTEVTLTRWSTISIDEKTGVTNLPGVFAAGDITTGASTVIEGIAGGRRAARAITQFLAGEEITPEPDLFFSRKDALGEVATGDLPSYDPAPRHEMPTIPIDRRISSFEEIETGLDENEAIAEALRCLGCGCTALHYCALRREAERYGCDQATHRGEVRNYEADQRHPHITIDLNKCILCAKCIRICDEVAGRRALGHVNRGFATEMRPALDRPLAETDCDACGLCVEVCPTGALADRLNATRPAPWDVVTTSSVCPECSLGCTLSVESFAGMIVRVAAGDGGENPFGNLCAAGRYRWRERAARSLEPHPEDPVARAREILATATPAGTAVVVAGSTTNEEAARLAELGALYVPGLVGLPEDWPWGDSSPHGLEALAHATAVLVAGECAPVAEMEIVRAAGRGAEIIAIGGVSDRLDRLVTRRVETPPADIERAVVVFDVEQVGQGAAARLAELAQETDSMVIALRGAANAVGLEVLGALPLPSSLEIDAVLVVGDAPPPEVIRAAFAGDHRLIVADGAPSALAERADVRLPLAPPLERGGSLTSFAGRTRRVETGLPPRGLPL